jgi:hypothetical protein
VKSKYVHREEGPEWVENCPLEVPVWSDGSVIGLCCTSRFVLLIERPVVDEKAIDQPGSNTLKRCKFGSLANHHHHHHHHHNHHRLELRFARVFCTCLLIGDRLCLLDSVPFTLYHMYIFFTHCGTRTLPLSRILRHSLFYIQGH